MNKIFIILLLFTSCISAFEYKSSHDQTYWFPANDHSLNGYHIGTVRSNLEWNDEMNFYVQEGYCNEPPLITFIFTTTNTLDLSEKKQDFNLKNYINHNVSFNMKFDSGYEDTIEVSIAEVINNYPEKDAFVFVIPNMPQVFVSTDPDEKIFNQFMSLTISSDDPVYNLFDEPTRSYRMGGLVPVWMDAHQKCLDSSIEVSHD